MRNQKKKNVFHSEFLIIHFRLIEHTTALGQCNTSEIPTTKISEDPTGRRRRPEPSPPESYIHACFESEKLGKPKMKTTGRAVALMDGRDEWAGSNG